MDGPIYTDVMVDIETTGLQPSAAAIIQIGAVPFNYDTGAIDSKNMFLASLMVPKNRYWCDGTDTFWLGQNLEVYKSIMAVARNPRDVMPEFHAYACALGEVRFWCKGLNFDFPFIESYMLDYGLDMPFNFRTAKDTRSFIAGLYGTAVYEDPVVEVVGDKHNALHDCLTQLRQVFKGKDETCQSVVVTA